jgi:hypothetical protein
MRDSVRSFVEQVDRTSTPDLWNVIRSRTPGPPPTDLGRGRRLLDAAVAIVVAVGALTIAYEALRVDQDATTVGTPTSPPVPMGEPRITAEIPLPKDSIGLGVAVGAGSAWVGVGLDLDTEQGTGELLRIDLATDDVVSKIPVTQPSGAIAATDDAIWVASHALLERIDPATNAVVAEVHVPGRQVSAVTADARDVWAVTIAEVSDDGARGVGSLIRIDQASNQIVAEIPLGSQLTGYHDEVRLGAGSVWVLGVRWIERENAEYGSDLIRVDPSTNRIAAHVPIGGFDMVVGADEVWVKFPADGVFDETAERWVWTRLNVQTNVASEPFAFEDDGLQLVSPEALWSVGYDEDENVRVTRFDPGSLRVEARSEPIRSYFTDAVLDPNSGTIWIAAVRSIIRLDIAGDGSV